MPQAQAARGEFDLIERHLSRLGAVRADVQLGVGDDAALLNPRCDTQGLTQVRSNCMQLALHGQSAQQITTAIETAVNAMVNEHDSNNFQSARATLVLSMPSADELLLTQIAAAAHEVCEQHDIAVVGGDTSAGAPSLLIFVNAIAR